MEKIKFNLSLFILYLCSVNLIGCSENEVSKLKDSPGSNADTRSYAMYFLGLRSNSSEIQSAMGASNPASPAGRTSGRIAPIAAMDFSMIQNSVDSIPAPFVSCATITESESPDGLMTTIMDFGSGCLETYGYFFSGKRIFSRKVISKLDSPIITVYYDGTSVHENFGGQFFNGFDTTNWSVSGKTDFSIRYNYDYVTPSVLSYYTVSDSSRYAANSLPYNYTCLVSSESTLDKSTTTSSNYQFSFDSGDYYLSTLIEPLVLDYACGQIQYNGYGTGIPPLSNYVSGREKITYSKDGVTGSFEIQYGDGTCDSIITILENGNSFEIDLSKEMVTLKQLIQ